VGLLIYGDHDQRTKDQLQRCVDAEDGSVGVLCADGHLGYSMPIGGVVGYRRYVSPSGVGYDIACGNMAVQTNVMAKDVLHAEMERLADEIQRRISFGVGRKNNEPVDDPVFDRIAASPVPQQRALLQMAQQQLGTVGSGNHYVDLFADEQDRLWAGVHFGSRGFGHGVATGFLNLAAGREFHAGQITGESMHAVPSLLPLTEAAARELGSADPGGSVEVGRRYEAAMRLAGEYAYAGREHVAGEVLRIVGAVAVETVHNHHNYAWNEEHGGGTVHVVRKGATPAFPGQAGFVGGSMGDWAVVVEGVDTPLAERTLRSTVHGAGRECGCC